MKQFCSDLLCVFVDGLGKLILGFWKESRNPESFVTSMEFEIQLVSKACEFVVIEATSWAISAYLMLCVQRDGSAPGDRSDSI